MSEKAIGVGPTQLTRVTPVVRMRRIRLNPTLLTGLGLLGLVVLVAITAPLLTPYDPIAQQFTDSFLPPFSPGHILGTRFPQPHRDGSEHVGNPAVLIDRSAAAVDIKSRD